MKIEHEIIHDLIPLYVEGTLSETSRKAVEDHLKDCSVCQKYLKEIQDACNELNADEMSHDFNAEAETLRRAKKTMKKKKIRTIILSIITAVIAVIIISYAWVDRMQNTLLPITASDPMKIQYDADGNLIAEVQGTSARNLKIADLKLDDSGKEVRCIVFSVETTKWNQLTAGSQTFTILVPLVDQNQGASEVDRVYYLTPEIGSEDMQYDELSHLRSVDELKGEKMLYTNTEKR